MLSVSCLFHRDKSSHELAITFGQGLDCCTILQWFRSDAGILYRIIPVAILFPVSPFPTAGSLFWNPGSEPISLIPCIAWKCCNIVCTKGKGQGFKNCGEDPQNLCLLGSILKSILKHPHCQCLSAVQCYLMPQKHELPWSDGLYSVSASGRRDGLDFWTFDWIMRVVNAAWTTEWVNKEYKS